MTPDELLERLHRPDLTLTASRRRADLIRPTRPQETQMDDAILIHLDRDGDRWTALAHPADAGTTGLLRNDRIARVADGPAAALEAVGQDLDAREAARLTALARGDVGAPLSVNEAVDRALMTDVATVVEALEAAQARAIGDQPHAMTTLHIGRRAGFTGHPDAADDVGAIAARARRALDRAVADGTVVHVRAGDLDLWRVATDDELERTDRLHELAEHHDPDVAERAEADLRAAAQDDARGEADR